MIAARICNASQARCVSEAIVEQVGKAAGGEIQLAFDRRQAQVDPARRDALGAEIIGRERWKKIAL